MWSYDATDLSTESASGRLNSVRFLVGDIVATDQQVQNEEIHFALSQNRNNVYLAGSFIAGVLAAKYAREVDVSLGDGALAEDSSDLAENYRQLQKSLRLQAQRQGSVSLGVASGELTENTFTQLQFDFGEGENVGTVSY